MRRIAIVGAGQAGLHLALTLLAAEYDVTLVTDRTAQEVRAGRVMSTQLMFGPARRLERAAGLNLWDATAPAAGTLRVTVWDPPGKNTLTFTGQFDEPPHSVDQRVKMAGWLGLYEARGGRVRYGSVTPAMLSTLAAEHDLTVVASGRGDLTRIFTRNPLYCPFDRPQRTLACVYVHGVTASADDSEQQTRFNAVAGAGEVFVLPALTTGGPCHIMLFEALPGGPFDCWYDQPSPHDCVTRALGLMRTYAPGEYELCRDAAPTDAGATLYGAVTPTVRHPVAEVAPDTYVLGMADAVVTNDPITGQGSNTAARNAAVYLDAILERGDAPFDAEWMRSAFAVFWRHARQVTEFTNLMLEPTPQHVQRLLVAAAQHPAVAHRFVNGYADPADYHDWLMTAAHADAYLATAGATR
ncbi:oxygenase [Streptomyces sp. CB02923]|uniref:styrene monooxygenase/indole monooxygenase family protein n=1 Tax=Streptomyces sp. CB02923 TaxID=1718985 RepID=UPI00093EAB8B|nr:styrene monooxygenase/indole monooxygenase family protein [Streptomyces sp. CB02923]OKI04593.1 oxygenase [Streptomyces sp. CB02923]